MTAPSGHGRLLSSGAARLCWPAVPLLAAIVSGCEGAQSTLAPGGAEAQAVRTLFLAMAIAGGAIWLGVVGLLAYALLRRKGAVGERKAGRLILLGGVVFPSVTLFGLLAYALWLMPGLRPFARADEPALRVEVTGKQFWWEVVYRSADGRPVVLANEIRLPKGQRVEIALKSADVIHSFWIPSLAGKMDMIPGRTNRLSIEATKAGTYRGPCAEYCGTSHALMALSAVVMEPDAFAGWLEEQSRPAVGVDAPGAGLFLRHGCGACHAVAGTEAHGRVGPDLSHLGGRQTLAAGILPNTEADIARFIAEPDRIKPGSGMPAFAMLPPEELRQIARWLKGLR